MANIAKVHDGVSETVRHKFRHDPAFYHFTKMVESVLSHRQLSIEDATEAFTLGIRLYEKRKENKRLPKAIVSDDPIQRLREGIRDRSDIPKFL